MEVKDFLVKLCDTCGISGYESERAAIIAEEFKNYCDDVSIDKFGNVIATKKGKGNGKIMFCAHMDEIGLIVSHIDEKGFVKLSTIGGFDDRTLVAQEVIIHGKEKIFGVLGVKPPHMTNADEAKKACKLEDMAVDTGFSGEELKRLISIGDAVTVNRKATQLLKNVMCAKSFDDIAGVASMLYSMKQLQHYKHDADVYFVASCQEEVGCRGAETSTFTVNPDIGIAIDVGFARTPELDEMDSSEFTGGPDVCCGPNISRKVFEGLKQAGKNGNTNLQLSVSPGMSGTDAYSMQMAGNGVATGVISIPLKYMHTSVEVLSLDSVDQTGKLVTDFVMLFNNTKMEEFLCF